MNGSQSDPRRWPPAAYAAALACLPGVGPAWLVDVLKLHSPERAWALVLAGQLGRPSRPGPSRPGPSRPRPASSALEWLEAARRVDVGFLWARCQRNRVKVSWPGQPGYPTALADGPSPPGVLFSAGQAATFEARPCAAVVGTRRCTPDGAAAAYQLGYELSRAGVCVVSGLALGIDGAAHAGALAAVRDLEEGHDRGDWGDRSDLGDIDPVVASNAGSTVGVAASGVDVIYPRQHQGLWREVVSLGVVLSETPPGWPAQAWRFPARNRLIAGLARIVVVVECHASGGSWHTVDSAIRRGIEVGAVPGPIRSSASVGTNTLLHEGATPIRGAQDVLDTLGIFDSKRAGATRTAKTDSTAALGAGGRFRGAADLFSHPRALPAAAAVAAPTRQASITRVNSPPPLAGPSTSPTTEDQALGDRPGPLEARVLVALGWRPLCLEEIVERSGLPAGAVVVALDRLEEHGLARAEAGWWSRTAE